MAAHGAAVLENPLPVELWAMVLQQLSPCGHLATRTRADSCNNDTSNSLAGCPCTPANTQLALRRVCKAWRAAIDRQTHAIALTATMQSMCARHNMSHMRAALTHAARCPSLDHLVLRTPGLGLDNAPPLTTLPNLTHLDISGSRVVSLSCLAPLTTLRTLRAAGCPALRPASLPPLPALASLDLSYTTWLQSLGCDATDTTAAGLFAATPRLTELVLAWCQWRSHLLGGISTLTALRALDLSNHVGFDGAAMALLQPLTDMTSLNLAGDVCVHSESLAALAGLPRLRALRLTGIYTLTAAALPHLALLPELRHLCLGACWLFRLWSAPLSLMRVRAMHFRVE